MIEVDGFALTAELGRGGFGTVYRATDHSHGRDVALKVLDRLEDEGARRRFDRERLAMGKLSGHPNIAVVYQSGLTTDDRPFIAMELLSGGSLADLIESHGRLDADQVVEIGAQLCNAISHAHAGGVLHLDMKPENVLFSEFGTVKVVDFGIAALVDDMRTSTILATPAYADPRVLEGENGTTSSDVYGVAATLYTLLSGAAPYASTSGSLGTFHKIANEPVPRVERSDVPHALADCLHRAMSKQPAGRPASIGELGRQLQASLPANTVSVPPPSGPVPASEPAAVPAVPPVGGVVESPAATQNRDWSATVGLALLGLAVVLLVGFIAVAVLGRGDGGGSSADPFAPEVGLDTTVAPDNPVQDPMSVTTSAPVTVASGTVAPLAGPTASNPRFSLQTTSGLPDPEVFVVPTGSTQLCLTWSYTGFDPGEAFELEWLIDGVLDPGSQSSGTNQGGSAGDFFGCVTNPAGLPAAVFEAIWSVGRQQVFTHALLVGDDRQAVPVALQNNSAQAVCEVYWAPIGSTSLGLPANVAQVPVGDRLEVTLPSGNYRTVVRNCAGDTIFEEADTEFLDEATLTLTP